MVNFHFFAPAAPGIKHNPLPKFIKILLGEPRVKNLFRKFEIRKSDVNFGPLSLTNSNA